jgi:hypothetical protein
MYPTLDLDRLEFRWDPMVFKGNRRLQRGHLRKGQSFLKGPIPWVWLSRAAQCPGRALHVALMFWFQAGLLKKTADVPLSLSRLRNLGTSRFAAARGLAALEKAGLVAVIRHRGRKPVVTLLDPVGG